MMEVVKWRENSRTDDAWTIRVDRLDALRIIYSLAEQLAAIEQNHDPNFVREEFHPKGLTYLSISVVNKEKGGAE